MKNLNTKIFLDSAFPQETKDVKELLGFLDGQTTNPSLMVKNLLSENSEQKISNEDLWKKYKETVIEISNVIGDKSVSIEVYADSKTKAEEMIERGRELFTWIPHAHIKLPIIPEGLKAAEVLVNEGVRVNMTLCFSQEQAAAVHSATRGAKKGDVFVSPFIGRLDDRGENGMSLIKNILKMYEVGDGHVEVLSASIRSLDHLLGALAVGSDIVTLPEKIIQEWKENNLIISEDNYKYDVGELKNIEYREIDLEKDWREYDIKHELTDVGLERFANDWNSVIG